jgi:hypothetical protein
MERAAAGGDIPVVLKWGLNDGSTRANCLFVAIGDARVPFYLDDIGIKNWYEILVKVSEGCVAVDYRIRFQAPEHPPKRRPYKRKQKPCADAEET